MVSQVRVGQTDVFCDYSSRSIDENFRSTNISLDDWIKVESGLADWEIENLLEKIVRRGRSEYSDKELGEGSMVALDWGSPMSPVDFKKWQCRMSLLLIFPNVTCQI